MVAYEGGQHLAGAGRDANNDGLVVRNNLAITGRGEDSGETGDLDGLDDLVIKGLV